MSGVKSLLLAIEVATRRRDQAVQVLAQARQAYAMAQNQLDQLQGYAGETASRWAVGARPVTGPELLGHHYQFMERLQGAIGLQKDVLAEKQRRIDTAQQGVLAAEFRLAGLNQVLKKRQREADAMQARREQRQTDEMAALRQGRAQEQSYTGESR